MNRLPHLLFAALVVALSSAWIPLSRRSPSQKRPNTTILISAVTTAAAAITNNEELLSAVRARRHRGMEKMRRIFIVRVVYRPRRGRIVIGIGPGLEAMGPSLFASCKEIHPSDIAQFTKSHQSSQLVERRRTSGNSTGSLG